MKVWVAAGTKDEYIQAPDLVRCVQDVHILQRILVVPESHSGSGTHCKEAEHSPRAPAVVKAANGN